MKIIDKYIVKTIFSSIIAVAFIWVVVFSFFDFLNDVDNIGTNDYGFLDGLYMLLLKIPRIIYKGIVPIMLIGTILALGNLANTSQIIVMRSASMSTFSIIRVVVATLLFVFMILATIGETFMPYLTEYSKQYKTKLLHQTTVKVDIGNFWIKDGGMILNAGKNYDGKNFAQIKLLSIQDNKLVSATTAERMAIAQNQAILGNANNYAIGDEKIEHTQNPTQKVTLLFDESLIAKLKKDPLDLSIVDLYRQVQFLTTNNLNSSYFAVEMFQRAIRPIVLIATALFAMLFIFGSMRNSSMGKKLFLGIAISLVLELYLRTSGALVLKFNYNYLVVVLGPILLFLFTNLYLLYKKI